MIIIDIKVFTKAKNGYNAVGIYDGKGVTVKNESVISKVTVARVNPIVSKLRSGKKVISTDFVMLKDVKFRSPSTLSTFVTENVCGRSKMEKI